MRPAIATGTLVQHVAAAKPERQPTITGRTVAVAAPAVPSTATNRVSTTASTTPMFGAVVDGKPSTPSPIGFSGPWGRAATAIDDVDMGTKHDVSKAKRRVEDVYDDDDDDAGELQQRLLKRRRRRL